MNAKTTVSPQEALDLIRQDKAILIDVREPDEFKAAHIANAVSLPLSILEHGFGLLHVPAEKIILVHCLKGLRGQSACARLGSIADVANPVLNIEGGLTAWETAGLPVIRADVKASRLSIFRQVQIIIGLLIALFVVVGYTISPTGFTIAGMLGAALFLAGLTGWCGLAMLLGRMPWNK